LRALALAAAASLSVVAIALATPGCDPGEISAVERGRDLMDDPDVSPSSLNHFACTTCHALTETQPATRRLAGYTLAGVAKRKTFYGGAEDRLLDAINFCIVQYMRGVALTETDANGRAMYEYLVSISPGAVTDGLPWTVIHAIPELTDPGDATRGKQLYDAACRECHGDLHTARGALEPRATKLPEEATTFYDANFPGIKHRLIVTEKLRNGGFFGIGGQMPPYGAELLTDAEIVDLYAYIGLPP